MKNYHPFFIAWLVFGIMSGIPCSDFKNPDMSVMFNKLEGLLSLVSLTVASTIYFLKSR